MSIRHRLTLTTRLCALGAALLLSGCGGVTSFQSKTFGPPTPAGPAAYGLQGTAANPSLTAQTGGPFFVEVSGLGSPDGSKVYLTAASDFKIISGAGPLSDVDPNKTSKVPIGFSTGGLYIDSLTGGGTFATPEAVAPGTPVVFRAAISNGISADGKSIPIKYNGVSLSSTDPEWTLSTLPMTFNFTNNGPLANGTYVTGQPVTTGNGTPVPFPLPFTTTGLHSLTVSVTDDNGQQTQTTYAIPVAQPSDVTVFAQSIDTGSKDKKGKEVFQPFEAGDKVALSAPVAGTQGDAVADQQGTVVLFTTPGARTLTYTSADGSTTYTQTLDLSNAAGTTVIQ
ncbi:MAG: hypothetical protein M3Y28_03740 [Armatimonadota bacterium]|nr:hypothetical protein [Armatimonadota bacterium]